jgi:hypothetical protein
MNCTRVLLAAAAVLTACGSRDFPPDAGKADAGRPDAGSGILPVTCFSQSKWTRGAEPSEEMYPGYACRACHLGQNFQGQNPTLVSAPLTANFFIGTIYGGFNEADGCNANAVPAGTVIEILDSTGQLKHTLEVSPSGNFRSFNNEPGLSLPYTVRVRSNGKVRVMATPQMDGDCNRCHTEQGREGAPGRIVWP